MNKNIFSWKSRAKAALLAFLLLPAVASVPACTKAETAPKESVAPEEKLLVSAEKVATLPASAFQLVAGSYSEELKGELKYNVGLYRITYKTTYQGKVLEASGVVALPLNRETPAPVISVQHGTIFKHDEAPSSLSKGLTGFEVFAAGGYATLIPDYIGFGASKQVLHPYYNQKYSGLAVVDMIKAAKELYAQEKVATSDQLFLAGYSEGGYVTMAAQKEIETNSAHGLKLTAVAAGAGGYDMTDMLATVVSGEPYSYPAYLAYVLMSLNNAYGWDRPLTDFYREPYATRLKEMFNGQHSGGSINGQLTTKPEELFTASFMAALRGNGEQQLKQALQENSFNNWVPQSPTRLYHGTGDVIVPFANSEKTYKQMKAAGAPALLLKPIDKGTHGSSFVPMVADVVPWFKSFDVKH